MSFYCNANGFQTISSINYDTAYRIFMCVYNDPYNGLLPAANMA
jgi:hypothetical protein